MIPHDYITEWRSHAPWVEDFQVEQDLVISRALVEIFSHPLLRDSLAFRGGTALHKLFLRPPARYSEDIDLVQIDAEPAGPVMDALRDTLGPWLGPKRRQSQGRVTLMHRFDSEDRPPVPLRLKLEINTREHFSVLGYREEAFSVASRWYSGASSITTFGLNELLATKLRALFQRRKGRDLFDLATALDHEAVDPDQIVSVFLEYMEREGQRITRARMEENLHAKWQDGRFLADVHPLLAGGASWNAEEGWARVQDELVVRLPGEAWRGEP